MHASVAAIISAAVLIIHCAVVSQAEVQITVRTDSLLQKLDKRFLSHTLDTNILNHPQVWNRLDPHSPLLVNLGRALSPSYLRFGGTQADFLFFRQTPSRPLPCSQRGQALPMTDQDWTKLNALAKAWNWLLLFNLNLVTSRDPETNQWNGTDAHELEQSTMSLGYKVDWQLGNEVNAKQDCSGVNGTTSGRDFSLLRTLAKNSSSSLIFGPDISTNNHKEIAFLSDFLVTGLSAVDIVTFHQYYGDSKTASISDFYDPAVLDRYPAVVSEVTAAVQGRRALAVTETGSFYGGGDVGLSDGFVASFMWLDKLGISGRMGVQMVMRQSLFHGSYALFDQNLTPHPDFWVSVLFKKLVGTRVLRVLNGTNNTLPSKFRCYAHCSPIHGSGSVTVYVLNLHEKKPSVFRVTSPDPGSSFENSSVLWYLLSPFGPEGVRSKQVNLNNVLLAMEGDQLPKMKPKTLKAGSAIGVPPLTLGFAVFPEARAAVC